MIIIIKNPGETAIVKEIDGSLRSMQKVVGGNIEIAHHTKVRLYDRQPLRLVTVCNEEGRLRGLAPNAFYCLGTIFFATIQKTDGEEDIAGFADAEEAQLVADLLNDCVSRGVHGL